MRRVKGREEERKGVETMRRWKMKSEMAKKKERRFEKRQKTGVQRLMDRKNVASNVPLQNA